MKELEEQRNYGALVKDFQQFVEPEEDAVSTYSESLNLGGHIIITMVVMYFFGYLVVMKTYGDLIWVRIPQNSMNHFEIEIIDLQSFRNRISY